MSEAKVQRKSSAFKDFFLSVLGRNKKNKSKNVPSKADTGDARSHLDFGVPETEVLKPFEKPKPPPNRRRPTMAANRRSLIGSTEEEPRQKPLEEVLRGPPPIPLGEKPRKPHEDQPKEEVPSQPVELHEEDPANVSADVLLRSTSQDAVSSCRGSKGESVDSGKHPASINNNRSLEVLTDENESSFTTCNSSFPAEGEKRSSAESGGEKRVSLGSGCSRESGRAWEVKEGSSSDEKEEEYFVPDSLEPLAAAN